MRVRDERTGEEGARLSSSTSTSEVTITDLEDIKQGHGCIEEDQGRTADLYLPVFSDDCLLFGSALGRAFLLLGPSSLDDLDFRFFGSFTGSGLAA